MEALKKLFMFSQKKAALTFRETETSKKFLIYQETELSYISGSNFPSSKSFLYFGKWNFLAASLKNFFINQTKKTCSK